jgi:hypothetical protein
VTAIGQGAPRSVPRAVPACRLAIETLPGQSIRPNDTHRFGF